MRWLLAGPIAAFDTETTGVDVENDRIVTATVAMLLPGEPWSVDSRSWLIDPGVDIPAEATAVHGISTERARDNGEQPPGALQEMAGRLARGLAARMPLVIMNAAYDLTLLDRELRRHNLPTLEERIGGPVTPVVDPYVIDKRVDPYRPGRRTLEALCAEYRVRIDGAHDSAFDALAGARVAYRLAQRAGMQTEELIDLYRDRKSPLEVASEFLLLGAMSPAELHANQIQWRAEQQASLLQYLRANRKPHADVDPHWPYRPHPTTAKAAA